MLGDKIEVESACFHGFIRDETRLVATQRKQTEAQVVQQRRRGSHVHLDVCKVREDRPRLEEFIDHRGPAVCALGSFHTRHAARELPSLPTCRGAVQGGKEGGIDGGNEGGNEGGSEALKATHRHNRYV